MQRSAVQWWMGTREGGRNSVILMHFRVVVLLSTCKSPEEISLNQFKVPCQLTAEFNVAVGISCCTVRARVGPVFAEGEFEYVLWCRPLSDGDNT